MTDADLKQAMKAVARLNGQPLADERIDKDLGAYKGHLKAIDAIAAVELPREAEPAPLIVLSPGNRP